MRATLPAAVSGGEAEAEPTTIPPALAATRPPLAILYLALAFPAVLFQVFGTPPFQMPDEPRHFMRALQIADGHLLARRSGDAFSGGDLEKAAQDVALAFTPLAHDRTMRLDPSLLARLAPLRWGVTAKVPAMFENTAIYPPLLYLPAALAIRIGKAIDLSILRTYYLARLAMGLVGVLGAALAVHLCVAGRTVLFVALSLPLALSAFGSVSQDGLAITAGALAIAAWSRSLSSVDAMSVKTRACVAVLLGAVIGARLPLLPLFALLALPASSRERFGTRAGDLAASALGLVPIGLGIVCASVAKIPFRATDGVAPDLQAALVLHAPGRALQALWNTVAHHGAEFLREMVSVLGWWSDMLPSFYYGWIGACLAVAALVEASLPLPDFPRWAKLATLAIVVTACIGVFASFYVAWTPVGSETIEGVQGRYFIVPCLLLVLALPRAGLPVAASGTPGPARLRGTMQVTICAAVGMLNLWAIPMTLLTRYYF